MVITMESLSIIFSSSPPIKTHSKTLNYPINKLNFNQTNTPNFKNPSLKKPLFQLTKTSLSFPTIHLLNSLPSLASETLDATQVSDKINLEEILVSIDNFFIKYPFFVYCCTFIWLVAIPVGKQLLSKYKYVSAISAFKKLKEDENVQLLDIRDRKSLKALKSPNLKILNKSSVHVAFTEDDEDGFVKNVLEKFDDPSNTALCILDSFDGNSLKVAELLFKNGFKEAYAIKGGVRGKKGWLEIQENLLPPSVHMYIKKKAKRSQPEINGVDPQTEEKSDIPSIERSTEESRRVYNGQANKSLHSTTKVKFDSRSPYPNYPDLKPPSSPTPSKP